MTPYSGLLPGGAESSARALAATVTTQTTKSPLRSEDECTEGR